MTYIKIGLALFFISLCPLIVGLYLVEAKMGFIAAGLVVLWIGIAMVSIGIMKRDRLLH